MSTIRRQSIISSFLIYIGFIFGAINTYLFTKQGIFTPEQYGLTRAFIVMGNFFYGFASFGVLPVIYKFFPYYKANLKDKQNDLLTICLVVAFIGFTLTTIAGVVFEPLVVRKFTAKSPLLVQYYFWIFPLTFFLLLFSLLEAYSWSLLKTIFPNFLKEAGFRISTTILIAVFIFAGIKFSLFIKLFSFLYAISFLALLIYIIYLKKFTITFQISRVTKKFYKKMLTLFAFVFSGSMITVAAQSVDSFSIASYVNLSLLAVFDFSIYITSIINVPQRSIVSISIPVLSNAWRDKDFATIRRVYSRSSLNLLLASLFIFSLIWLNYDSAIKVFNLNKLYETGKIVVLLVGFKNIIDMGTGVNAQIIATSMYWRFEFMCGVVLLCLAIPLNIILVKKIGIEGAAISNLVAYTVYNIIRLYFLWYKFKMQPFSKNTLYVITHTLACYFICLLLFRNMQSFAGIIIRTIAFIALFGSSAIFLKLSPDIAPVWKTVKKRMGIKA
jgi:O-antigen/teichoic acid export membrane protein